jgi:hypothetical protein
MEHIVDGLWAVGGNADGLAGANERRDQGEVV